MRRCNDDLMIVRIHIQFWRILDGEGGYIHDGMEGAEHDKTQNAKTKKIRNCKSPWSLRVIVTFEGGRA